jgi:hypothetical protein
MTEIRKDLFWLMTLEGSIVPGSHVVGQSIMVGGPCAEGDCSLHGRQETERDRRAVARYNFQ